MDTLLTVVGFIIWIAFWAFIGFWTAKTIMTVSDIRLYLEEGDTRKANAVLLCYSVWFGTHAANGLAYAYVTVANCVSKDTHYYVS